MARSVRLDFPESLCHVLSRGNERREIFYDEEDYQQFLKLLARMSKKYCLEIHAYVLMPNHYHLLIRAKQAHLSRGLQWLGVSYAVWFNRRHKRSGHLFQGRFKSFLVQDEKYFAALCLYIHGNPLRAGLVQNLSEYRWSSYRGYVNRDEEEAWVKKELVLSLYGGNPKKFERDQRASLKQLPKILDDLHSGLYLGKEEFAQECLAMVKGKEHPEKPQIRSVLQRQNIREIAIRVLRSLDETDPELILRTTSRKEKPMRDMGIYILTQLGIFTNRAIGELFGVGYTAITESAKRAESRLAHDKTMGQKVGKILNDN
jgi:putative transposase